MDKDYEHATIEQLKQWSSERDAEALRKLAMAYLAGKLVERNPEKSFELFQESAALGNAKAMNSLGYSYRKGRGVKEDHLESIQWFSKAARAGNASAMFNMGVSFYYGRGVDQDYSRAFGWYKKAANLGHTDAMYSLARMYKYGRGVSKDAQLACDTYLKYAHHSGDVLGFFKAMKLARSQSALQDKFDDALTGLLEKNYPIYQCFKKACVGLEYAVDLDFAFREFMERVVECENQHLITKDSVLYHYTTASTIDQWLSRPYGVPEDKLRLYLLAYLHPEEGQYLWADEFALNPEIGHVVERLQADAYCFNQENHSVVAELYPQVYGTSLSKHADHLPLWQAYGQGQGVSIGIPIKTLKRFKNKISYGYSVEPEDPMTTDAQSSELLLYEVKYGEAAVMQCWTMLKKPLLYLLSLIDQVESLSTKRQLRVCIIRALAQLMYLYKHESHQAEQEVRILRLAPLHDRHLKLDEASPAQLYLETPPLLFQDEGVQLTLAPQTDRQRVRWLWLFRKKVMDGGLAQKVAVECSTIPAHHLDKQKS